MYEIRDTRSSLYLTNFDDGHPDINIKSCFKVRIKCRGSHSDCSRHVSTSSKSTALDVTFGFRSHKSTFELCYMRSHKSCTRVCVCAYVDGCRRRWRPTNLFTPIEMSAERSVGDNCTEPINTLSQQQDIIIKNGYTRVC